MIDFNIRDARLFVQIDGCSAASNIRANDDRIYAHGDRVPENPGAETHSNRPDGSTETIAQQPPDTASSASMQRRSSVTSSGLPFAIISRMEFLKPEQ